MIIPRARLEKRLLGIKRYYLIYFTEQDKLQILIWKDTVYYADNPESCANFFFGHKYHINILTHKLTMFNVIDAL